MNKNDFINEVAKRKGISRTKAYHSVNDVMDTLRVILSQGEDVEVGGFGKFGVLVDLSGERIPVFKGGRALKNVLNIKGGDVNGKTK